MIISFEGIDGSGKTTILKAINEKLLKLDLNPRIISGSISGYTGSSISKVDSLLKRVTHESDLVLDDKTEFCVYLARLREKRNTAQSYLEKNTKDIVLIDRYVDSPFVLAIYGRKIDKIFVESSLDWIIEGLWPDITFVCEVSSAQEGLERKKKSSEALSRKELEGAKLHDKLHYGFQSLPNCFRDRSFKKINTSGVSIDESVELAWTNVVGALKKRELF